jgi:L-malate glycosyltransferase
LRITVLCPHLRIAGGVRAILTYADRLARRGHDVDVVVPARGWHRAAWRSLTGDGPRWMGEFTARVRWVSAWHPERLRDADVLVATAWQSADAVAAAPLRAGAKFYLVQHYEGLYHGRPEAVDRTYRLPLGKIAISTWLGEILRERFASDAEVVVTPVDGRVFHPVDVVVRTPRPRVLMLHHSYEWKGVADGMEAVARVKARVPGLTLVGFGVKRPRGAGYDEFHADPRQDRLAALYSSADIYLCPSWDEGLGMPSMEAMACGAALVTYDNGGSRDYARDGETALVARRRDVADLADKLERLALDAPLRRKLAASGRAHVTSAYDWDRAVDTVERLFTRAARGA